MSRKAYPDLDTLLSTMNTLEQQKKNEQPLWNPITQMQLISKSTNEDINHPYNLGPTLLSLGSKPVQQNTSSQNLFFQNYIKPQDASKDFQTSLSNVSAVQQQVQRDTNQPNDISRKCQVFPPLLVRYDDPKSRDDKYVAIKILSGGEIKATSDVPDMILNFHADTHAITVTICNIDPKKVKDFEITIWALYSMFDKDPENMLDITSFTILYDQTRYELLKAILAHNKNK
jgi:hypothetical protein